MALAGLGMLERIRYGLYLGILVVGLFQRPARRETMFSESFGAYRLKKFSYQCGDDQGGGKDSH